MESKEGESMVYNFEQAIREGFIKSEEKGMEKGIEKGLEKGLEKGRIEERLEIARTALSEGLPVELVKKLTGLEIEKLKDLEKEKANPH